MGDWGIATWWGTGSPPRLPGRLGGDGRWAVRLGRMGDRGLWPINTLSGCCCSDLERCRSNGRVSIG